MGVAVTFADDNALVVEPGGQVACPVIVENTGMVVDGILLDILGDAAEWASVEPAEVNLLPGASATATISFRPPRAATLAPGDVPFGLRAMSREDPDGSRIEEGVVRIGEFSDLDVSLVPTSSTGRRSARFKLVIENRGNRPESMTVEAADADAKLAFRSRPTIFSAPPGTATFVRLTAVPRKTFFKGPSRTLPFEVSALPEAGKPVKAQGTMLEKQTLPEWLLPVLGVAVVLAGLILALWLTVLRPIVHSATTAAADAGRAAGSAKSAAGLAKSAMQAARNASSKKPAASPPPSALDVTLPVPTLLARTTELASATGTFAKAGGSLPTLVWTSSNPKIAAVSKNGVVTGMRPGMATITATTSSGKSRPHGRSGSGRSPSPGARTALKSSAVSGSATVNVVAKVAISSSAQPEAAIGKPYSTSLAATGGTGSFTWSLDGGSLPAGLSLDPATGAITGTPTKLGSSKFTVRVADAGPPTQFATKSVTVLVAKPLAVNTSLLPGGTVGGRYTSSLAAVGGTAPYQWSVTPGNGSLPAGLSLNPATGAITGTPTSAGTSTFVVQVSDAATPSQSSTESLSIAVTSPLVLSTLTLPAGVLNASYSQTLSAFGGASPYTWSISSGSLPAGLTLNPTSGSLGGTPTATGTSTFTVQIADSGKPSVSVSRSFTVTVVHAFGTTTSSLPQAAAGQPYTGQVSAAGGVAPYTWTLQGTLPPGLSLSPAGTITGTPTATGNFPFTVQAVDSTSPPLSATASLSITVVSSLRIKTTTLPEAVTGAAYSQSIEVTGGAAPYIWTLTSGSLPAGLRLSRTTGAVTGTPVMTGTSTFTVQVRDSTTPTVNSASLTVAINVVEPLVFTEPTLPDAVQGNFYGPVTPNHISGGSGQYTWTITSGVLPAGLSLDQNTGTISGTMTTSAALGAQNFTLTLVDANDPAITASQPETINVFGPLQMAPGSVSVTAGHSISQNLASLVSGGRAPYTFSMPATDGLSVDPSTGTISGTPDAPCPDGGNVQNQGGTIVVQCPRSVFNATLTVTDADGNVATAPVTVHASVPDLVVDPVSSLPNVSDSVGYDQQTVVGGAAPSGGYQPSGGRGGFSFSTSAVSVTGPLGVGANNNGLPCEEVGCSAGELGMNPANGEISGDITDLIGGTTWTFIVVIVDTDPLNSANTITVAFELSISA